MNIYQVLHFTQSHSRLLEKLPHDTIEFSVHACESLKRAILNLKVSAVSGKPLGLNRAYFLTSQKKHIRCI